MSGDHNMNQKPVAWQVMVEDEAMKEFPIKDMAHDWCVHQKLSGSPYSYWIRPLYTNPPAAPRQEQYDQTALELCEECGWKAIIPGDGCLVCARQKAQPVWIQRNHLEAAQREPSMCRVEPTNRLPDFVPLYTAPPPKYRRGTYVRCMESDELCRVWTTSIDGGAWVKWPDGSITTYTAEQMGQAFSLEQAAPGKPVAYADSRIHGWPDCFVMEPDPPHTVPLYTEPREWVGLTEEEINAIYVQHHNQFGECISGDWGYERDLEAKLKERNHAG